MAAKPSIEVIFLGRGKFSLNFAANCVALTLKPPQIPVAVAPSASIVNTLGIGVSCCGGSRALACFSAGFSTF